MGGHNVPPETIRRRYHARLKYFFAIYQQLADTWRIYDNSAPGSPRLLSTGERTILTKVVDAPLWDSLKGTYHG